jgi:hypothetical protein
MNQPQRSLVLVLALCAFLASSGSPGSSGVRHVHLIYRTQAHATCLARRIQSRASHLLACASCILRCPDTLPNLLEHIGLPTELVRESQ